MESRGGNDDWNSAGTDVAPILGDLRARRILSILFERSEPIPVRELSVQLAAREGDVPPPAVPESTLESVLMALEHRYLPTLTAVEWIHREPAGVTATRSRLPTPEALSLPPVREPANPHWDPISVLLERPRRTTVVQYLAERQASQTLAEIAAHLHDAAYPSPAHAPSGTGQLRTALYHVDLPKLATVDLVAFDPEELTAARTPLTSAVLD